MYLNGKNITIIDHSVNCVEAILADLRKRKPLSAEQEHNLWLSMRQGSKRACDRLVESNMLYAMRIAKQYLPSGAALEDLFQAGCEGLVLAAHKFDATLGFRFISFATWYVENEVRKAAYNYIKNNHASLDESIDPKDDEAPNRIDFLASRPCQSSDWDLRYTDALKHLQVRAEERQPGLGRLTFDLHQMLLDGYTTSDFARKHHLNDTQMSRLLTILYEEATHHLSIAA